MKQGVCNCAASWALAGEPKYELCWGEAPGVLWLWYKIDGKENLFFLTTQRSIVMSYTPQKLGFLLSYFAYSVHLTKRFGCLFFWRGACSLLPVPSLIPFQSKSKMLCLRRGFWRCMFSRRPVQCKDRSPWCLKGSFKQVWKSDKQIIILWYQRFWWRV